LVVPKYPNSFRLSDDALRLIAAIANKLGIGRTAVLEMAIRKLAEKENVK